MHRFCRDCKHEDADMREQPCRDCKWIMRGSSDGFEPKTPPTDWQARAEVAEKDADRLAKLMEYLRSVLANDGAWRLADLLGEALDKHAAAVAKRGQA